jgi:hypothetical protein
VNLRRLAQLCFPIAALSWLLGGCAAVSVRPEGDLPKPLVVPTPAKVGVVVTAEAANYVHKESRASVNYEAQLGPEHKHIVEQIFEAAFADAKMFDTVDAARLEPGVMAIFEPRIEQFSFANSRETGGVYTAVTIRYQILIYAPNGELIETLTLTGYGSGPAPKIGNGEEELGIAAFAAMRDAAAKFLTQFPALDVAKPLLASHALVPKAMPLPGSPEAAAALADVTIEAVPINDSAVVATTQAPSPVPQAPPPKDPAPSPPPSQMASPYPATTL